MKGEDKDRGKRHRPVMPSNARVFEQAGNPWVTQKEGRENYGRTLETENPETDKDWYARRAPERRPEVIKEKPKEKNYLADNHRRRVNSVMAYKNKRKPIIR